MEQIFEQFGIKYLRWTKDGHTFEAVKEQVDFYGKEVFEQDADDKYDYVDSWLAEHGSSFRMPEWI